MTNFKLLASQQMNFIEGALLLRFCLEFALSISLLKKLTNITTSFWIKTCVVIYLIDEKKICQKYVQCALRETNLL